MTVWLVDTGPLVAYLVAADPAHDEVAECIDGFTGMLVTSGAVITEAMYFVADSQGGPERLAQFAAASAIRIYDVAQPAELHAAAKMMERYANTPMDYADATLVLLAEALGVTDVLTLDRRGFAAYRTRQRRAFHLVLDHMRS